MQKNGTVGPRDLYCFTIGRCSGSIEIVIEWILSLAEEVVLLAHNAQAFDMRHMLYNVVRCQITESFSSVVTGFGDNLPYFKEAYKATYLEFKLVVKPI